MVVTRGQKWLFIGLQTLFSAALAVWILVRVGQWLEPLSVFVALAIIIGGDIVTALLMQRFAPTAITMGPGEIAQWTGRADTDFDVGGSGRVTVKGERWAAVNRGAAPIDAGDRVRVVARSGLTLRVERLEGD